MRNNLLFIFTFAFGLTANAEFCKERAPHIQSLHHFFTQAYPTEALNWKVGDAAQYNLKVGFFSGKMTMVVREEVPEGFWVEQNINMSVKNSKIEMLFDRTDAKVLRLIVDGKEKPAPNRDDLEVIDSRPETVSTLAGTFDCLWTKVRDKRRNSLQEAWMTPEVPILGIAKLKGQSKYGKIVSELIAYEKK